jgi:hypothetical protein
VYAFLISPMRATRPAHLILLDLITLITFSEVPHYAASRHFLHPDVLTTNPPPCPWQFNQTMRCKVLHFRFLQKWNSTVKWYANRQRAAKFQWQKFSLTFTYAVVQFQNIDPLFTYFIQTDLKQ